MQKYQTNWLSPLNTFVLKGNFISLSQVENEYHLLEVEGYHENKTILLNFSRYCFLPKALGLKPALSMLPGSSGREVSFSSHFGLTCMGALQVKSTKHVLIFCFSSVREEAVTSLRADPPRWWTLQQRGPRGTPSIYNSLGLPTSHNPKASELGYRGRN